MLSPAYDLNPTLDRHQALLVSRDSNESDPELLLEAAEDYYIPKDEAARIITEVKNALKDWRVVARRLGLPERDIDIFAGRFMIG